MWEFNKENESLLKTLCNSYAPTSNEVLAQRVVAQRCQEIGVDCWGDAAGNLYAGININSDFRIGIVAHIDEIGLQITQITACGLLRFRKLGGVKATSLIGDRVVILTPTGIVDGIVGCDPLQDNGTETGILVKTSDLWIDIGAQNIDEASSMVTIGQFALYTANYSRLKEEYIVSKALDNRVGTFIMLEALKELQKSNLNIGVVCVSSVQEELNCSGISACVERMNTAIVVDVDFATDIITEHSDMGFLKLGSGLGINLNADSNIVMQKHLAKIAQEHSINIQSTLSRNISGGTDAAKLRLNGNIATLNVNIPLRYMHTHTEMCHYRDIESAVNAIVLLIKHIDSNKIKSFVPWQDL